VAEVVTLQNPSNSPVTVKKLYFAQSIQQASHCEVVIPCIFHPTGHSAVGVAFSVVATKLIPPQITAIVQ
jgi:hypothetical protein